MRIESAPVDPSTIAQLLNGNTLDLSLIHILLVAGNKCDLAEEEQIEAFRDYVEAKGYEFFPIMAAIPTIDVYKRQIAGLSTIGSISLGMALVAGSTRVPNPAAGITALVTFMGKPPVWFVLFSFPIYKK